MPPADPERSGKETTPPLLSGMVAVAASLDQGPTAQLIQQVLEGDLGFTGFVTSDRGGTHSTVAPADSGLDQEMNGSDFYGAALTGTITTPVGTVAHRTTARQVAEEGSVLLKNASAALPLGTANKKTPSRRGHGSAVRGHGSGVRGSHALRRAGQPPSAGSTYSPGRLTTIASCVLRAITTTASSAGSGFSSRCGTKGGTKM